MNTILEFCAKCTETFGYVLGIIILVIFSPVFIALGLLACFIAVPIGAIYKIISWIVKGTK